MESELLVRRLLGLLGNEDQPPQQASRSSAVGGHNGGIQGQFNNRGQGSQNFRDINYNSGAAYSDNGNTYPTYNDKGRSLIHNSGTTRGNGNGSIIFGGFDSSTRP